MISVVISAHNEEKNIKDCIDSVSDFASEIIVLDNDSTDKTAEIAKKNGAIVYHQPNDVKKIDIQKNLGFDKATMPWILSLDADERISPKLAHEIVTVISEESKTSGYWIPRKNIIFGKWIKHSLWWPDYQLRLFRKGKGRFPQATVHMPIEVKGETKHLSEPMEHKSYETIQGFVNRMNNIYTEVEADGLAEKSPRLHWSDSIKMPVSDFFKTFFLQRGYKDGMHGLMLSILQAFYTFLVFAKVWEKQGFYERGEKEILVGMEKEFHSASFQWKHWLFTVYKNETRNPIKKMLYMISKKLIS